MIGFESEVFMCRSFPQISFRDLLTHADGTLAPEAWHTNHPTPPCVKDPK